MGASRITSAVCLAIAALGCSDDTDSNGSTTTASTTGGGGSSGGSDAAGGSGGSGGSSNLGGSGGSSPASTSGVGGSGGVSSNVTSSTDGGAGAAGAPQDPGEPIPFSDGWASEDDNEVGIQGSFYTFHDNGDSDSNGVVGESSIEPEDFADGGQEICANGTIVHVMEGPDGSPAYADYWGAAIGFNLHQEEGEDTALPYDATEHGVVGFSFVISGSDPIPPAGQLRFNLKVSGDTNNYCATILTAGLNRILFTDLPRSCWTVDPTAPTADPTQLEAVHWQYVTDADESYDFDICISDLRAIVESD